MPCFWKMPPPLFSAVGVGIRYVRIEISGYKSRALSQVISKLICMPITAMIKNHHIIKNQFSKLDVI